MSVLVRRIVMVVLGLVLVAAVVFAFLPEPLEVDVAEVGTGPMQVTVDEEGQTRIKERYVISAPLGGRLQRVTLDPGDEVEDGRTVVAVIEPTDPQLLDARARAEADARVRAAEAGLSQAGANLEQARTTLDFAEDEYTSVRDALARNAATEREVRELETLNKRAIEGFKAAQFAQDIARYELDLAQSALLHTRADDNDQTSVRFEIRAPITGRVLRVFQESVSIIAPGTPLLEVGDPADLEIVIDVLSTDAVQIVPGAKMEIDHWGGPEPLLASVRLIEPSAFTKVSALGVDEQRVNVIADFVSPPEDRLTLGDGFRVEGRIVLWEGQDVVQVPASALFRHETQWAVFVIESGRAVLRSVEIGRQNGLVAHVLGDLRSGDTVIVHPSDRVADGVKVVAR